MKAQLLPCPFCGGKAKIHKGLNNFIDMEIQCGICGCSGGCFDNEYDPALMPDKVNGDRLAAEECNRNVAITHWNTRYQRNPNTGRWVKVSV